MSISSSLTKFLKSIFTVEYHAALRRQRRDRELYPRHTEGGEQGVSCADIYDILKRKETLAYVCNCIERLRNNAQGIG